MEDSSVLPLAERLELAVTYRTQNPFTSVRNVARTFDVPPSTLGHRLKGRRDVKTYRQSRQRLTVLEEASLVKWMIQLMNWGWPPTISQLERMASHLLICKGDREPLGVNWYEAFIARHPEPQILESLRPGQKRYQRPRILSQMVRSIHKHNQGVRNSIRRSIQHG